MRKVSLKDWSLATADDAISGPRLRWIIKHFEQIYRFLFGTEDVNIVKRNIEQKSIFIK